MYLCGPTVQDAPHVGHARTAIAFDVVRRHFAWSGYQVTFVRNITDIDDKIIARAGKLGMSPAEVAHRYANEYRQAMDAVRVLPPDHEPRVTENIPQIIDFVERLIARGAAYAAGGDVYYAVDSFPDYGRLSGQSIDDLRAGARVEPGEYKRNPLDFALWKATKPGEPRWDSPWGAGRPGWHIECSAMALRHLGESFDVHAGGKDLIFPHHENEIAQSQGALGPGTFARTWMHTGFVNLNDEKMSKSVGNVFLVSDMIGRFDGEALRFSMLGTHYRSPINFEVAERDGRVVFPGLEKAERDLEYFYGTLRRLDEFVGERSQPDAGPVVAEADQVVSAVRAALDDDFNTSVAMAELYAAATLSNKLLDDSKAAPKDVRRRSLQRLGQDLREAARRPLGLLEQNPREFLQGRRARLATARGIDQDAVEARLRERDAARQNQDFGRADEIRGELRTLGIEVMDTKAGSDWRISE